MRTFRILLRHELAALLLAPGTYVAAVLFLAVLGFLFHSIVGTYVAQAQEETPSAALAALFWVPVFFMVPLLTMRSLAEERRSGTLETLLTAPVSPGAVVLAKFSAAWLLYAGLWLATLAYPWLLGLHVPDARVADWRAVLCGYLFLAVSGGLFVAIGIFCSALCRTQLVAGILSFALLFALVVGGRYASEVLRLVEERHRLAVRAVDYLQVFEHADTFSRGIVDVQPLVFYLSGTVAVLFLAVLAVEARAARR